MTGFSFLILFGLGCLVSPYKGEVFPPPGGIEKYFALGSNVTLQWTYNDNASAVRFRSWHFKSRDSSKEKSIAEIDGNRPPDILNNDLPRVRIEKPATLVLENVDLRYHGTYRFQLAAARGGGGSESVIVTITVKPAVTVNCFRTTTLNEGASFKCLCKGTGGRPQPANVTWYDKDGVQIGETGKEEKSLTLSNVGKTDTGTFTCVAQSHEVSKNKTSIELIVNFKPSVTRFTPSLVKPAVGQSVTITCVASGRPEPSYTIFHNGTKVSTNKTYIIPEVQWSDAGTYICNATNKLGNDIESLTLIVVVGTHRNDHKKKRGLSTGVIAAIVVGVLALVVIIIAVIYWFKFKSKQKNHEEEGNAAAPLKKRRADANVYDAVATGGDDGEASTSTAPHDYATLEQPMTYAALDTVALRSSGSKKQNDGKEPPTQYASIDVGKVGKVDKD